MTDNDERAQITASLAAKLSHKGKPDDMKKQSFDLSSMASLNMGGAGPSSSTPSSQYMNPNMAYAASSLGAAGDAAVQHASTKLQQQASAVVIAKLLAHAGVTEEQLKQLTIQDQEQIISMVQNRYTQKDIDKLIAKELRNNLQQQQQRQQQLAHSSLQKDPAAHAAGIKKIQNMFKHAAHNHPPNMDQSVNGYVVNDKLPTFNDNKMYMGTLPTVVHPAATSLVQANVPQQTRLVSQLSNAPVNPLVTNLFTPTIPPQMLKPHVRSQALHHQVVPGAAAPLTTTHPAVLLQMQAKQMYLNQMAAQHQQQQHVNQVYAAAAAQQKQQQLLAAAANQQAQQQRLGLGKFHSRKKFLRYTSTIEIQLKQRLKKPQICCESLIAIAIELRIRLQISNRCMIRSIHLHGGFSQKVHSQWSLLKPGHNRRPQC